MLTFKINYYSHLLLNSKYKLFIHLCIIFVIYTMIYNTNYASCMNNTNNIIETPINETTNSQAEDLRREISAYADSYASSLEKNNILEQKLQRMFADTRYYCNEIEHLRKQNGALGRTIQELRENVADLSETANNNYNAYKEQCIASGHAGNHVHELKQELNTARQEIKILRSSVKLMEDLIASLQR